MVLIIQTGQHCWCFDRLNINVDVMGPACDSNINKVELNAIRLNEERKSEELVYE